MSVQKTNLNLTIYEYSLWFPCVNFISYAQRPLPSSTSKASAYLDLTSRGFPTNFTVGADMLTYIRGNSDKSACTFVAKWRGSAIYNHNSFGSVTGGNMSRTYGSQSWVSGSLNGSAQVNGRVTFTLSGASNFVSPVTIKGDATAATNPLTELVICRLDEEDYYDQQRQAGVLPAFVFSSSAAAVVPNKGPYLIDELKSFKAGSLRMMGSQSINTSVLSRWAERPDTNPLTLHYNKYSKLVSSDGSHANLGLLANTGDVYSGVYGSAGAYVHGEIFQGCVQASNTTTTPTLNIDGRGAKPIYTFINSTTFKPGAPDATGINPVYRLQVGIIYTFIYDQNYGASGAWIYENRDIPCGYPLEWLIALCNAVGQVGWFCIPFYADDDYVTQFGNLLMSTYTPPTVNIEFANEIWNTQGSDDMTVRAEQAGLSHFTSPQIGTGNNAAVSAWYGLRFRQIAAILRPILGSKLKMILACRGGAADPGNNITTEIENVRLQNTTYTELSGTNSPWKFADALSHQLYFGAPSVISDTDSGWAATTNASTLKTYVDAWIADNSQTAGFDWLKTTWLADTSYTGFVSSGGRHDKWNTLAAKYGLPIEMYEGNHQIKYPSATWTAANAPWNNASYGDVTGSINLFLKAFWKSQQYQGFFTSYLTSAYSYSNVKGVALLAIVGAQPWPSHDFPNESTNASGSINEAPLGNYIAHKLWNNKTTRSIKLSN